MSKKRKHHSAEQIVKKLRDAETMLSAGFSICVSNTDDHLRNHGFLLQPDGWKLSPA